VPVDGYAKANKARSRDGHLSKSGRTDLLDVLDNLEATGHFLLGR
jgi:hypothetical protein